jgi:hypothetical protein
VVVAILLTGPNKAAQISILADPDPQPRTRDSYELLTQRKYHTLRQCCGSGSGSTGSMCFWASWIGSGFISQKYGSGSGWAPDPDPFIIRQK